MKTTILRLLMVCLGVLLMACVLSHSAGAQTVISFDTSPDDAMVMKIHNPELQTQPHKFVFIFDSASITYEFGENGDISLYAINLAGSGSSSSYFIHSDDRASTNQEQLQDPSFDFNSYLLNEEVVEEPMELESWMLSPNEWMNTGKEASQNM